MFRARDLVAYGEFADDRTVAHLLALFPRSNAQGLCLSADAATSVPNSGGVKFQRYTRLVDPDVTDHSADPSGFSKGSDHVIGNMLDHPRVKRLVCRWSVLPILREQKHGACYKKCDDNFYFIHVKIL